MTAMESLFHTTTAHTGAWIREVMSILGTRDERKGLRALRAGLHTLRDHLPPAEVVHLGAQLPMLLRGLYYEGWRPEARRKRPRDADGVWRAVRVHLGPDSTLDPARVLGAVLGVLDHHVSAGELRDVAHTLPRALSDVWASGPST
jgi:uncharacterized protein (DUF2267 family)